MSKFWMVTEDPMYDDDGILVDEDADFLSKEVQDEILLELETYDPFETVNS